MTTTQKAAKTLRYAGYKAAASANANIITIKNAKDAELIKVSEILSRIYKNFDAIIISSK
jgi:hypothetical protein